MGGTSSTTRLTSRARVASIAAGLLVSVVGAACSSGGGATTPANEVDAAAAYTAMVEWQAAEQEPVVNDDGTTRLPVIYIVAADGETIDVGVQASVAAATVDLATVRFADDVSDAFDADLDDEMVRDSGTLLLVAGMPPNGATITVDLVRYLAAERHEPFQLEITADDLGTGTISGATVTAVSQP